MKRLIGSLLCVCLLATGSPGRAQDAGVGYQPQDQDERGLWMLMDEQERELKSSDFVVRDPALNQYVLHVFCRTVGEAECKSVRLYIVRTPYFNASMAPNGMLQIWTGLLLRVRNEAELAAILSHEYIHYEKRHSLMLFRNLRRNTGVARFLAATAYGAPLALAVLSSSFAYSRENEREADSGGLTLMAKAGYDPAASPAIWEQVRKEQEATATARNAKPRYHDGGLFATHPNTLERMNALDAQASTMAAPGGVLNAEAYRKALAPWWPQFFDDEIKLNDFGGSEFLLGQLAATGWTPALLFARGELYRSRGRPDDLERAAGFYRQAIEGQDAPTEAYRGLGLALLREGKQPEGRAALKLYIEKKPDATDKAMMAMLAAVAT